MLKIVSWNIGHRPEVWRAVIDCDADVVLLQEACEPPSDIASRFDVGSEPWHTEGAGTKRPWRTAIVRLSTRVRLDRIQTFPIAEATSTDFALSRPGTLTAAHVKDLEAGGSHTLVSMYAAWERPHSSTESAWIYADASAHRLVSDISTLVGRENGHRIVAAGDLNILYGHGENGSLYWAGRYQTVFDRFSSIGLNFVGPQFPNGRQADPWPEELPRESLNVPTFHTNRQTPANATRQLDFVFASKSISGNVIASAQNAPDKWGQSDHCQVHIRVR